MMTQTFPAASDRLFPSSFHLEEEQVQVGLHVQLPLRKRKEKVISLTFDSYKMYSFHHITT